MPIEALRVFVSKQPPPQSKAEAATDALIAELHRVIDDLRQDRNEWRELAQRLGELGAPARPGPQLALPAPESAQPEQPIATTPSEPRRNGWWWWRRSA